MMTGTLAERWSGIRAAHELELAMVCLDGVVLGVDARAEIDADRVGQTASDLVLLMRVIGAEMDRGSLRMSILEYEGGTLVVTHLPTGEDLLLLSAETVNVGRVRMAARRFRESYEKSGVMA